MGGLGWGVLSVGLCFCPLVYVFVRWCVYIFRRREIHGALTLLQAPRFYRARRVVACHPRVLRFNLTCKYFLSVKFGDMAEVKTFLYILSNGKDGKVLKQANSEANPKNKK